MNKKQTTVDRRTFLSSAAMIGASSTLGAGSLFTSCSVDNKEVKYTPLRPASEYSLPEVGDKAIDGKPLKAGVVGCGSRGTGAAINFLDAGDGLSIVALSDTFQDRLTRCRERLKERKNVEIPDAMCFVGLESYKKLCELDLDVVIIASPQLFHPEHLRYAIEQGKHVFCEKPACVDAAGYRTFIMAVRQAQAKGLCLVPGTHKFSNRGYREAYKLVQEGYIGDIVSANVWFCQGGLTHTRRQPGWTDMEFMLRDFFMWYWLCGDHVVDQFVHAIDIFNWFSHSRPERVLAIGSRQRRFSGNIYDNFGMDFEYPGGIIVRGLARQIDNCDNRVAETIIGTKGTFNAVSEGRELNIRDHAGNLVWEYDHEAAKEKFQQRDPYTLEHVDLVNHIRSGKVINNGERLATSTMSCIMARESAYTGKICTWEEMTQSDMNFMPADFSLRNVDRSLYMVPAPAGPPVQHANWQL